MEKAKQNLVDCLLLEVSIDVTTLLYHLVISRHFCSTKASILSEVEADKIPFPRLLQIYIDLHKIVDSKDTKVLLTYVVSLNYCYYLLNLLISTPAANVQKEVCRVTRTFCYGSKTAQ